MTTNYEALGRYVTATEEVKRLQSLQRDLITDIERLVRVAKFDYGSSDAVYRFDESKLLAYSQQLAETHARLLEAVSDANHHASDAGKPKIRIVEK